MLVLQKEDKIIIQVDEWCNKIVTTQEGTFLEVDKDVWDEAKEELKDGK